MGNHASWTPSFECLAKSSDQPLSWHFQTSIFLSCVKQNKKKLLVAIYNVLTTNSTSDSGDD